MAFAVRSLRYAGIDLPILDATLEGNPGRAWEIRAYLPGTAPQGLPSDGWVCPIMGNGKPTGIDMYGSVAQDLQVGQLTDRPADRLLVIVSMDAGDRTPPEDYCEAD